MATPESPVRSGAAEEPRGARRGLGRRLAAWELGGIAIPVIILAIGSSLAFRGFASSFNVDSLLAFVAVTGVVGLAQMSVLSIGQFNLAIAAIGAFVAMILGWLLQVGGVPLVPAVAIAIAAGAAFGLVQGSLIVGLKLNPFIVTLGLASAFEGLMYTTLGNQQFQTLGPAIGDLGRGAIGPVPYILFLSIGIAACVWVLMQRTVIGREILATGASPLAALFSAIPSGRRVLVAHTLSGTLAAAAAVLLVARLASAQPAIGQDWLLPSFAAPVLGGTLLSGGKVSVAGTMLGALLLAMIANALVIAGVSQYWYQAGLGLIILGAVVLELARTRLLARGAA